MKHLKFFEQHHDKLYWEMDEEDFASDEIIDVNMPDSLQAKIRNLIKEDFIISTRQAKGFQFIKISYDLKKSTIQSRKFQCEIYLIHDDYFLVSFESWFDSGEWSQRYFQCDAFEGLTNLLHDLGLTKKSTGYIL